ncbi:hypothetical protein KCU93_g3476, partial [Aureobasidium melanogenum]
MNSLISATRYTTVYGPDVTVTLPGSSFTTMGPDAYCETCPDACYVDFNDDGIPDAEQNGTFPTNGTFRNNSTNSAPVPAPVVIADTNFENGTGDPLTSSASSPNVTAVIAQSNDSTPLMAQSGQSYLFLTFNSGSGSQQQQLLRRQSSNQPLVYNASQSFPTVADDTYNVTAYAQQAQDGPNPPDCSISLCVYDSCSTPASLSTGVWQQYYYLYLATYDDDSATATFSITCAGNAYVGLDNIAIVDIPPPDSSASASSTGDSGSGSSAPSGSSVSLTTLSGGSVITVTRTIVRTRTTSAIVSTAVYYTTTQVSYVVSTYESDNTYTTYQPTTLVSTAYATATSLQNITVSAIVTSTISSAPGTTSTVISTYLTTQQASTVVSTSLVLTTIPASSYTQTLTLTATATATATLTDTQSQTTTQTATQTLTQISITTAYVITTAPALPASTDNHLYLVPRVATTGHIHPIHNHNSNVDSHNNCYDNTAQHCLRSYASASNLHSVSSYSSACDKYTDTDCNHDCDKCSDTNICHYRSSSSCKHFNNDIYASVYHHADSYDYCSSTSSKYCNNHIHVISSNTSARHIYSIHNYDSDIDRYYNLHGVSGYSSACDEHTDADSDRHANSDCYDNSTSQYGDFSATSCHHYPDTDIDLYSACPNDNSDVDCDRHAYFYYKLDIHNSACSTISDRGIPNHDCIVAAPTVALASPTAIFNSSQAHDDDLAWRVMPFAINLCGYNFTNVTVSVNGVLGFGITNSYSPSSLPQYSALSPSGYALMPFWADLYIYQGTAQGIYYEVDGSSPSRVLTFEYYASYYQQSNNYYHFQVLFYENNTGSFTFKYLNITDSGANAVVGYQCQPKSKYKQYSSKQAIITNGLRVDYTYSNDTFTSSQVAAASRATVLSPVIDFMSRIAGKVSDTWRSATGWLRGHPTNTTTLAAIRKMSSPEQSSTEKKNDKTRETYRRGPEDGYPFIVDEVFKQRGPEPIPEPVAVRRVSRPAGPHRASKKAAVFESESSAVRVGEVAPGSTSIRVSSMQTPANNPFAVSNAGLQPSSRISEITRGQHQIKDTSRPIESAARPASLHTTMSGVYAESDDGGVELPEHIDSENNHDAARRVEAGSGPDSSGPGTPEDVSKHDGGGEGKLGFQPSTGAGKTGAKDVVHEGDKLERIFARLDALKRPGRGN